MQLWFLLISSSLTLLGNSLSDCCGENRPWSSSAESCHPRDCAAASGTQPEGHWSKSISYHLQIPSLFVLYLFISLPSPGQACNLFPGWIHTDESVIRDFYSRKILLFASSVRVSIFSVSHWANCTLTSRKTRTQVYRLRSWTPAFPSERQVPGWATDRTKPAFYSVNLSDLSSWLILLFIWNH